MNIYFSRVQLKTQITHQMEAKKNLSQIPEDSTREYLSRNTTSAKDALHESPSFPPFLSSIQTHHQYNQPSVIDQILPKSLNTRLPSILFHRHLWNKEVLAA